MPLPIGYDPERTLVISASQLGNYHTCKRKWWFNRVQKLDEPPKMHFLFGETLHKVLERWLEADQLGIDPQTSMPVDLYPPGWNAGLTPRESDLIQKLVAAGIEKGMIVRHPNREIEHGFIRHLADVGGSANTAQGWSVFITGFIDLLLPHRIEDHKTTSNMRYARSKAKLRKDTQMLIYAGELLMLAAEHGIELERVELAHNVFLKDAESPRIRKTECKGDDEDEGAVTREEIIKHWASVQRDSIAMLELKLRYPFENQHHEVPGPENTQQACRKYGGCPYLPICGGRISPHEYRVSVTRLIQEHERKLAMSTSIFSQHTGALMGAQGAPGAAPAAPALNPPTPPPAQAPDLSTTMFWWLAKRDDQQPSQATGAQIQAALAANPALADHPCMKHGDKEWSQVGVVFGSPTPAPAAPQRQAAPWGRQDCTSCGGSGWNSQGGVCAICESLNQRDGTFTSANYDIVQNGDGTVTVTMKSAPAAPAAPQTAQTVEIPNAAPQVEEAKPKGKKKGKKKKDEEAPAPATTPATTEESTDLFDSIQIKPGRGRPPKTFVLLIDAVPVGEKAIDAALILQQLGDALASERGANSYYELPAFERRDMIASVVPKLVEQMLNKGEFVTVNSSSPDLDMLVTALRPYAHLTIEGTR